MKGGVWVTEENFWVIFPKLKYYGKDCFKGRNCCGKKKLQEKNVEKMLQKCNFHNLFFPQHFLPLLLFPKKLMFWLVLYVRFGVDMTPCNINCMQLFTAKLKLFLNNSVTISGCIFQWWIYITYQSWPVFVFFP